MVQTNIVGSCSTTTYCLLCDFHLFLPNFGHFLPFVPFTSTEWTANGLQTCWARVSARVHRRHFPIAQGGCPIPFAFPQHLIIVPMPNRADQGHFPVVAPQNWKGIQWMG